MDIYKLKATRLTPGYNNFEISVQIGGVATACEPFNSTIAERLNKIFSIDLTGYSTPFCLTFTEEFGTDVDDDLDKYAWSEKLDIIFGGQLAEVVGGLCIKDTPYPPPYKNSRKGKMPVIATQIEDAVIQELTLTTISKANDNYELDVVLKRRSGQNFTNLKGNGCYLHTDLTKNKKVIIVSLTDEPGANSPTIEVSGANLSLHNNNNCGHGIPIVLCEDIPADFTSIIRKRGIILI